MRRVLNDDSDGEYSDESEAEISSEEDDDNGGPQQEESKASESDEMPSGGKSSDESGTNFLRYKVTDFIGASFTSLF